MKAIELIMQSLGENREYIENAIKGLSQEELAWRPKPHSNSIAFLLWHLARVEDLWINRILLGEKEVYEAAGWYKKFGTPAQDSGFGYDVEKLNSWPVPKLALLKEYAGVVREKTLAYLKSVNEKKLDEPKDFGWSKGTVGTALVTPDFRDRRAFWSDRLSAGHHAGDREPPPPPK